MKPRRGKIKFGITLPVWPLEDIFWTARFADKKGFDAVSLIDHIASPESLYIPEAFITLTTISSMTKRVRLMTGVSDPHRRHPAVMAQMAATLDIVSNGRFTLGLGAGEAMNVEPYGIEWSKPVSKLREFILLLKKLWGGQPVTYGGEFFKLADASISIETLQKPHPPIWVGALSRRTLEITGELADGWYPTAIPPDHYMTNLQIVKDAAKKFGRDPERIVPAVEVAIAVAKEHTLAEEQMVPLGRAYLTLFPNLLERLGYGDAAKKEFGLQELTLTRASRAALERASMDIPIEAVERVCAFGTPDECTAFIEKFVQAGATHFTLIPMGSMDFAKESILPLLVERVIPHFAACR